VVAVIPGGKVAREGCMVTPEKASARKLAEAPRLAIGARRGQKIRAAPGPGKVMAKYFGKVESGWAGFSSEHRIKIPHFEKQVEVFLGEEFDEDGQHYR